MTTTIHLRARLARFVSRIGLAVAQFFDRGVDSFLGEFIKLDAKLDRFISRQEDKQASLARLFQLSLERQRAARLAEGEHRWDLAAAEDASRDQVERAKRIKDRIGDLLQ
jgi:hypothetical protein